MRKAKKSTSKIYRKEKLKKAIRRAERLAIKHNVPIYTDQQASEDAKDA